jgi:hypothetical protein
MVTYMIQRTGSDEALLLLVVWRGSPGWYAQGGRSGSSEGGDETTERHRFWEGKYEFEVTVDRTKGVAHVLGTDIRLNEANAVFVDEVDGARGPRIVKSALVTSRLGTTQPTAPERVVTLLGQLPDVREYVRCDTRLPDPRMQASLAPVCEQLMKSAPSR